MNGLYCRSMCAINSASLEISYAHLADMQSLLAIWLTDVPRDMLQIFDEVLQAVVLADFPHYNKVGGWISRKLDGRMLGDVLVQIL